MREGLEISNSKLKSEENAPSRNYSKRGLLSLILMLFNEPG
jgi:hypothetical protein